MRHEKIDENWLSFNQNNVKENCSSRRNESADIKNIENGVCMREL